MDGGEAQLIESAKRGDHRAFRQLIDRHARPIFGVCHRILGDAASAEDAVQDALLSAFRGLDRFDGRSQFGTWLHRIAVNAAIMQLRAKKPEIGFDDLSPAHVTNADAADRASHAHESRDDGPATRLAHAPDHPESFAAGHELSRHLSTALAGLTPLERTAFVLKHLEQYSLEEIAHALESNVNATKQAVFRAVHKLRAALAPLRSEP